GVRNYTNYPAWFPTVPHGWNYWQTNGFSKLLDFWDTGRYTGTSLRLDQEAAGTVRLGLAEVSNGNFLGEDALYDEVVPARDHFHHFPFPSLYSSTTFTLIRSRLAP